MQLVYMSFMDGPAWSGLWLSSLELARNLPQRGSVKMIKLEVFPILHKVSLWGWKCNQFGPFFPINFQKPFTAGFLLHHYRRTAEYLLGCQIMVNPKACWVSLFCQPSLLTLRTKSPSRFFTLTKTCLSKKKKQVWYVIVSLLDCEI